MKVWRNSLEARCDRADAAEWRETASLRPAPEAATEHPRNVLRQSSAFGFPVLPTLIRRSAR